MTSRLNGLGLLLGAGFSIPGGLPSTGAITGRVLSGKGMYRHSNETYQDISAVSQDIVPEDCVPRVTGFLEFLCRQVKLRYSHKGEFRPTYEDLYNIVAQVHGDLTGTFDNPAIGLLVSSLSEEVESLPQSSGGPSTPPWDFPVFVQHRRNYIRDVTWCELRSKKMDYTYLRGLVELIDQFPSEVVNVFTLNHDMLLEHALFDAEIAVNFGFAEPNQDRVREWAPELFDTSSPKTRLFKLHGSINWFIRRVGSESVKYVVDLSDEPYWKSDIEEDRPVMLLGTTNKLLEYTQGIFDDLHCLYCRELRRCDRLVVCGYSFGDKAINTQVVEWLLESDTRRMLLIHPRLDNLKRRARPAIQCLLKSPTYGPRITKMEVGIEDLDWNEVRQWLQS